jgi:WD40 repeat protein
LQTLEGHTSRITSVAFYHNDRWLASGSSDSAVRIRYSQTGALTQELENGTSDALVKVSRVLRTRGKGIEARVQNHLNNLDRVIRIYRIAIDSTIEHLKILSVLINRLPHRLTKDGEPVVRSQNLDPEC